MNAVNNETDNTSKQSSNYCMQTPATENEYNKLKNNKPRIGNPGYTEIWSNIDKMKQNKVREFAKEKERQSTGKI